MSNAARCKKRGWTLQEGTMMEDIAGGENDEVDFKELR